MSTDTTTTMTPPAEPPRRTGYKHPKGSHKHEIATELFRCQLENQRLQNDLAAAKQQQQQAEDFAAVERKATEMARADLASLKNQLQIAKDFGDVEHNLSEALHNDIKEKGELLDIANRECVRLNDRVRSLEESQCFLCKARAWWGKGATA